MALKFKKPFKARCIALCVIFVFLSACGLGVGGNAFNDPVPPDGVEVRNGELKGYNSVTASAYVRIFAVSGNAYVIRFENLSIDYNGNYAIRAEGSPSATYQTQLRGGSGNQNYYPPSTGAAVNWNALKIIDLGRVAGQQDVAITSFNL